ncbi:hypothetical protein HYALB_00010396 [Hymenoscyphus albidus]|uniref:Uncharacterized protein n=1 Tax=Hymenoscyphus albidus TaxID=595503 RepID=A0A9N9Q8E0_9HELO|nr:hypothetical protein HYALB_00010396 [Hymenoscyphus albidus]
MRFLTSIFIAVLASGAITNASTIARCKSDTSTVAANDNATKKACGAYKNNGCPNCAFVNNDGAFCENTRGDIVADDWDALCKLNGSTGSEVHNEL